MHKLSSLSVYSNSPTKIRQDAQPSKVYVLLESYPDHRGKNGMFFPLAAIFHKNKKGKKNKREWLLKPFRSVL
jgi:hypothetical protein